MFWYLVTYLAGIAVASASSLKDVEYILTMVSPIALTALVASLIVPFAAFARTEGVQKWLVQYAIVPIFGMYTVLVWEKGSLVGIFILVASATVHLGYWTSSCHSRMYRFDQYTHGFGVLLPATTRVLTRLNGVGGSQIADRIIQAIFRDQPIDADVIASTRAIVGEKAVRELEEEQERK